MSSLNFSRTTDRYSEEASVFCNQQLRYFLHIVHSLCWILLDVLWSLHDPKWKEINKRQDWTSGEASSRQTVMRGGVVDWPGSNRIQYGFQQGWELGIVEWILKPFDVQMLWIETFIWFLASVFLLWLLCVFKLIVLHTKVLMHLLLTCSCQCLLCVFVYQPWRSHELRFMLI